jgi:hypothetical protein
MKHLRLRRFPATLNQSFENPPPEVLPVSKDELLKREALQKREHKS